MNQRETEKLRTALIEKGYSIFEVERMIYSNTGLFPQCNAYDGRDLFDARSNRDNLEEKGFSKSLRKIFGK